MPGFPLLNLGTALGGLVKGYGQQQQDAQQRQLNALLAQLRQNQLQQVVRDQKARQLLGALAGTPDAAGLFGAGGGQMMQPPMPGQASQPGGGGQAPQPLMPPQASQPASSGNTSLPDTPSDDGGMSPVPWKASGGGGMSPVPWKQPDTGPVGPQSIPDRRKYTLDYARSRGVSPVLIDRLVESEGGWKTYDTTGDHGLSFGPFQDYTGGGLGNQLRARGIEVDPRKPGFDEGKVLRANVDYIAANGASPDVWHGLRRGGGGGGGGIGGGAGVDGGSMPRIAPPIYRPPPQGYDMNNLAAQLRKTNPGIDPETMFSALDQYQHLMDGPSKDAWERFKFETQNQRHDYEFRVGEQDKSIERELEQTRFNIQQRRLDQSDLRADRRDSIAERRLEIAEGAGQEKGWQVMPTGDPNNPFIRVQPGTGKIEPIALPKGTTKMGSPNQAANTITPELESGIVDAIGTYRAPPPSMSGWSGARAQHIMTQVMQKYPDYDATQFTAKQRAANAMGLRSGQLETQARVAEEEIPLTLQTSEKIDRTEYPTINSMLIAVERGTGDENVVQFLDQLNALKIVYASALSRSGVNTVDSMKRFDDILNAAWSKGQIRAALEQFQKTLAAERRGIDKAMGRGTKGGTAPPADAGAGGDSIPVPEAYKDDPDGQDYQKDGETWVKKGDKLIKTPGAVQVPR